jgi:nucleotide-binding universal stress UspA family protein
MKPTIVVGYDGSAASERALVEAAHQASLRGLPLTIVHALPPEVPEAPIPAADGSQDPRLRDSEDLLAGGADLVRYRHPEVTVHTSPVAGSVPVVLAHAAHDAALLVLGSRGLGRLESMLLGSVSIRTLAEADCPVLVVRDGEPVPHARVIAAVDLDDSEDEVLDFAFAESARRGVPLRAIHVWDEAWVYDAETDLMDADAAVAMDLADRRARLEALTRLWQAKYPDVRARWDVLKSDAPEVVLAEASQTADLLVLGARRHAQGHGLQIGIVTRPLLQHAACPVAIVPTG